jgi:membrane associated rhomboid family serine protease
MPQGIRNILIATVGVFILQIFPAFDYWLTGFGALSRNLVFGNAQVWRLASYMFLHGGPFHLLFNMLALWMFGVEIEQMWGTRRFVTFYFLTGIASGLFCAFIPGPIVGASGAILALLTVYAFYFPRRQVLMFFIFPVPVWAAVLIIGFISVTAAQSGAGGIAHMVHLGGIAAGFIYFRAYDPIVNRFESWRSHHRALKTERETRERAEQRVRKERYFEDVIDPILKKISEQGMESLTDKEKQTLRESARTHRDQLRRRKILPLDFSERE